MELRAPWAGQGEWPTMEDTVWKVGMVQPLTEGGYGFNITDESDRPIAFFGYEGRAEAEAAATHAQAVVKDAVSVRAMK